MTPTVFEDDERLLYINYTGCGINSQMLMVFPCFVLSQCGRQHQAELHQHVWAYQMLLRNTRSLPSIPDIQHGGDKQPAFCRPFPSALEARWLINSALPKVHWQDSEHVSQAGDKILQSCSDSTLELWVFVTEPSGPRAQMLTVSLYRQTGIT